MAKENKLLILAEKIFMLTQDRNDWEYGWKHKSMTIFPLELHDSPWSGEKWAMSPEIKIGDSKIRLCLSGNSSRIGYHEEKTFNREGFHYTIRLFVNNQCDDLPGGTYRGKFPWFRKKTWYEKFIDDLICGEYDNRDKGSINHLIREADRMLLELSSSSEKELESFEEKLKESISTRLKDC